MKAEKVVLDGVHPDLVAKYHAIAAGLRIATGDQLAAVYGVRTDAEQHALWRQGREVPGRVVTDKDGTTTKSMHQKQADGYGHAIDVVFLDHNGQPSWDNHYPWQAFGALAEAVGLRWGGRFVSLQDFGHIELRLPPPTPPSPRKA